MTLPPGNCRFQDISVSCHHCPKHPPSATAHATTTVTNSEIITAWHYHAVMHQNTRSYCSTDSCRIDMSFGHHSRIIVGRYQCRFGCAHQPLHPSRLLPLHGHGNIKHHWPDFCKNRAPMYPLDDFYFLRVGCCRRCSLIFPFS